MTQSDASPGAASSAPTSQPAPAGSRVPNVRRRAVLWCAFALLAAGVAVWGVLQGPWYQEHRLSRLSLEQLQRERGGRINDSRLLYYIGMRLNQRGLYS